MRFGVSIVSKFRGGILKTGLIYFSVSRRPDKKIRYAPIGFAFGRKRKRDKGGNDHDVDGTLHLNYYSHECFFDVYKL